MRSHNRRLSGIIRATPSQLARFAHHQTQAVPDQPWVPLPARLSTWENDHEGDCDTAEEMCNIAEQFGYVVPDADLQPFLNNYGLANGASSIDVLELFRNTGIKSGGYRYTDGPYSVVDPTDPDALCSAMYSGITLRGIPAAVKLDVDGDQLQSAVNLELPWSIVTGLRRTGRVNHDTHVCRVGPAAQLIDALNTQYGTLIQQPPNLAPDTPCAIHFTWGQYQLMDLQSVSNFATQGYVRAPSSIQVSA